MPPLLSSLSANPNLTVGTIIDLPAEKRFVFAKSSGKFGTLYRRAIDNSPYIF